MVEIVEAFTSMPRSSGVQVSRSQLTVSSNKKLSQTILRFSPSILATVTKLSQQEIEEALFHHDRHHLHNGIAAYLVSINQCPDLLNTQKLVGNINMRATSALAIPLAIAHLATTATGYVDKSFTPCLSTIRACTNLCVAAKGLVCTRQ